MPEDLSVTETISILENVDIMLLIETYVLPWSINIVMAVAIFLLGKFVVKMVVKFAKKIMVKAKVDNILVNFIASIISTILLLFVVIAALDQLGVATTSLIALIGAAGLAVGLALKDSLSNIGAAVLIIIFRPFKVGDTIEAAGTTGTVKDINLFSTIIEPVDKRIIIVPNSSIIGGNITNFSQRKERRVEHVFGIGYDDDLKLAKETLMQIIKDDGRVLDEPAPLVAVGELGESSVKFTFRAWTTTQDYWDVHFDMLEKVKLAFDEKEISIP